jgi:hypothetical protein
MAQLLSVTANCRETWAESEAPNGFSTAKDTEPFFKAVVKQVLQNDVPNGQFVVKFEKPTPWIGKHLPLKHGFRLITCEPATGISSALKTVRGQHKLQFTKPGNYHRCVVSSPHGRQNAPNPEKSAPPKKRKLNAGPNRPRMAPDLNRITMETKTWRMNSKWDEEDE